MTAQEALNPADTLLYSTFGERLNNIQSVVLLEVCWDAPMRKLRCR
ncbi:hypothetical protein [Nostoc sp. UHCC 0251]|nr:hypothetical protein [Nostoc sp. UHCC 0251]MEA5625974.1 hypothetical protein [Nostoc sp. UHCC 0251]